MTSIPTRPVFSSNILADCMADEFSHSFKAMRIDVRPDGDRFAVSHMIIEILYKGNLPSPPIPITKKSLGGLLDTAQSGLGYQVTSELVQKIDDLITAQALTRLVERAWAEDPQWDIFDNMWARVPDHWPMPLVAAQPFRVTSSAARARQIGLRLV